MNKPKLTINELFSGIGAQIQGLKNSIERSKVPNELCQHIADICEEEYNNEKI